MSEELMLTCMQIISAVGTARSEYIEAIRLAKDNKIEEAKAKIEEGEKIFLEGHHAHSSLLTKEANGELSVGLILIHAEDQLMSAETLKIVATEFIDLYENVIYKK